MAHVRRLTSTHGAINPVGLRGLILAAHGALSRIGLDALFSKVPGKLTPPLAECRLSNVQPLPLLAHRLNDEVNMRVWLIRMQDHRISMLKRELLARERAARLKKPGR